MASPGPARLRYRALPMTFRAAIFDLGGVVFPSPFDVFDEYERTHGLPPRFIRTVVASSTDHGAWGRLERSEYTFDEFCEAFAAECREAGGEVDARELMMQIGKGFSPRPEMMQAIASIRAHGLKVGALTNNWARTDTPTDDAPHSLGHLGAFDVVVESAVEGLRKPDPRIYTLVCDRLGVTPDEAVFLDDLGVNLKPAREMGMTTIKVVDVASALAELETVLGFALDGS